MAKTAYHRVAEQISSYADDVLPDFVKDMRDRVASAANPTSAPQTHQQRMGQSDSGHENPGPGKKKKGLGTL